MRQPEQQNQKNVLKGDFYKTLTSHTQNRLTFCLPAERPEFKSLKSQVDSFQTKTQKSEPVAFLPGAQQ